MRTHVYLAVSAEDEGVNSAFPKAHMAYGLGHTQYRLQTDRLPLSTRRGLLVLRDQTVPKQGDFNLLVRQLLQECSRRAYAGVIADFEHAPTKDRLTVLLTLLPALTRMGLPLAVPESYGPHMPDNAKILVSSAISGGSITERLGSAVQTWPGRVWLELRRLMMDFTLPCPSGEGTALTKAELDGLQAAHPGISFFSSELGCHYFTYQEGPQAHFVLFDTANSLHHKLVLAQSMGIDTAVLLYPETADILSDLEQLLL